MDSQFLHKSSQNVHNLDTKWLIFSPLLPENCPILPIFDFLCGRKVGRNWKIWEFLSDFSQFLHKVEKVHPVKNCEFGVFAHFLPTF